MIKEKCVSVKLDSRENVYLERLARESGRSKGAVVQRLIVFAVQSNDALRYLGAWDYLGNQPKKIEFESTH